MRGIFLKGDCEPQCILSCVPVSRLAQGIEAPMAIFTKASMLIDALF